MGETRQMASVFEIVTNKESMRKREFNLVKVNVYYINQDV
jgi:hypothetical protein